MLDDGADDEDELTHLLAAHDDALGLALALQPAVHLLERVLGLESLRHDAVIGPKLAVVEEGEAKVEEADTASELGADRGRLADRGEERI